MEKKMFVCPKCGCHEFINDQFQATGGNFAKLFDVQNKRFITVSCKQCGFTEIIKFTCRNVHGNANILTRLIASP